MKDFTPSWIRPKPPRFEEQDKVSFSHLFPSYLNAHTLLLKVIWLHPSIVDFNLMWDKSMVICEPNDEFKSLMEKAFTTNLLPAEAKLILKKLEENPKLVLKSGLTPAKLPNLIEWNSNIAIEVLLQLMSSNQITE